MMNVVFLLAENRPSLYASSVLCLASMFPVCLEESSVEALEEDTLDSVLLLTHFTSRS